MPAQFQRKGYAADTFYDGRREGSHPDVPGAAEAHYLLDNGRLRHFVRDREIYGDGDKADHIFKVTAGIVRTYKFLRDGRRHVDAFYRKGAVFGLELGERYSISAAAASDCTVISYRLNGLPMYAASDERALLHLLPSALDCLARAQAHSLSLGCRTAVERLAKFLIAYHEGTSSADERPGSSDEGAGSSNDIVLTITRKDIADHLGLTIETVSRTFAELEHRALIELHGARQVRLADQEGLRELCL